MFDFDIFLARPFGLDWSKVETHTWKNHEIKVGPLTIILSIRRE